MRVHYEDLYSKNFFFNCTLVNIECFLSNILQYVFYVLIAEIS